MPAPEIGSDDIRRVIEGDVVLLQTTVVQDEAFRAYQARMLPKMDDRDLALVEQGFDAGWQEALRQVAKEIWDSNGDWRTRQRPVY